MVIQDPPIFMEWDLTNGVSNFDKDLLKSYTKTGNTVEYLVWPVLYLHKNGPLLCKGVAQGHNKTISNESEVWGTIITCITGMVSDIVRTTSWRKWNDSSSLDIHIVNVVPVCMQSHFWSRINWIVLTYILVLILRSELACVQNYYENNKCFYLLCILGDVLLCVPR